VIKGYHSPPTQPSSAVSSRGTVLCLLWTQMATSSYSRPFSVVSKLIQLQAYTSTGQKPPKVSAYLNESLTAPQCHLERPTTTNKPTSYHLQFFVQTLFLCISTHLYHTTISLFEFSTISHTIQPINLGLSASHFSFSRAQFYRRSSLGRISSYIGGNKSGSRCVCIHASSGLASHQTITHTTLIRFYLFLSDWMDWFP